MSIQDCLGQRWPRQTRSSDNVFSAETVVQTSKLLNAMESVRIPSQLPKHPPQLSRSSPAASHGMSDCRVLVQQILNKLVGLIGSGCC